MPVSSTRDDGALLVVGTATALKTATVLIEAHREHRRVVVHRVSSRAERMLDRLPDEVRRDAFDAVIVLVPTTRPIADVIGGTHVELGDRVVPAGAVPATLPAAWAIAGVQGRIVAGRRRPARGPLVVLCGRSDDAQQRATDLQQRLGRTRVAHRALRSGAVTRADLLAALDTGPGAVLYTGAASPLGWDGYGGLQAWELDRPGREPIGAVISLSCSGAERIGSTLAMCEELVGRGVAASALGARTTVLGDDNRALGQAIVQRLGSGATCLADALDPTWPELADYRICGDPLASFVGAKGSKAAVDHVYAPDVGDPLPPVDWSTPPS